MNNLKYNPLSPTHDPTGAKAKYIKDARMKNDITSPSKPLTEFQKIKESAKSIASQEAAEGSYSWMDVYVGCLETNIKHLIEGKAGVEKKLDMILERLDSTESEAPEICPHCDGSGEGKSMIVCPFCKGSGEIERGIG